MTGLTIADIQQRVSEKSFGAPLITNVLRGAVAEAIIACALEPQWTWCSADYASWDFEHDDGVRLEVKQSAARQSWAKSDAKPSVAGFDIAPCQGYWNTQGQWVPEPGRQAQIYILAHHPIADDSADHRDPAQWDFYVIATSALPATRRISLTSLRRLAEPCSYAALRSRVDAVADTMSV